MKHAYVESLISQPGSFHHTTYLFNITTLLRPHRARFSPSAQSKLGFLVDPVQCVTGHEIEMSHEHIMSESSELNLNAHGKFYSFIVER